MAITDLQVVRTTSTSLTLTWEDTQVYSSVAYQVLYRRTGTTAWQTGPGTNGTTATLTGLVPDARYDVGVRIVGTSISSILRVTTQPLGTPPGAIATLTPSGLTATQVTLTWTAPTTGTTPFTYQVQQSPSGTPAWSNVGSTTQSLSQTIAGLPTNTALQFQVVVTNSSGSNVSPTVQVTTPALLPSAPTNLATAAAPTSTTAALTWSGSNQGTAPITYQVQSRTPSGVGGFSNIGSVVTATSETITGLTPGASYDFQVLPINIAGTGPASSVLAGVTTPSNQTLPAAPQNPAAGTVNLTSIQITWTQPASGTTPFTYTLQWRPSGSGAFTNNPSVSTLFDTVVGLTQSTAYDFQVFATNGAGSGIPSVLITVSTATVASVAPGAPTAVSSPSIGQTSVNLAWTAPATGTTPFTYQPQYSVHGANTWVNGPQVGTTSAQITGLVSGTSYDFRVSATNSVGTGPNSSPLYTVSTLASSPVVTWNTAGASSTIQFSSDKLSATMTGPSTPFSTPQGCLSTTAQTVGKWWYQVTVNSNFTPDTSIGLANSNAAVGEVGGSGSDSNSVGFWAANPAPGNVQNTLALIFNNTEIFNSGGTTVNGDVTGAIVTCLLDMDAAPPQVYFQTPAMVAAFGANCWNDSSTADPGNGVGGASVAIAGALFIYGSAWEGGDVMVLNASGTPLGSVVVPSNFAPWAGGVTTATAPGQVTGLAVGAISATSVALTWNQPSGTPPLTYTVQYRVTGTTTFATFAANMVGTQATVTSLSSSTQYDFQVFANNAAGSGAASTIASATTTVATAVPGAPVGLNVTAQIAGSTQTMSLTWQAPTTGGVPTGYRVQDRITGTATFATVHTLGNVLSDTVTGLTLNTQYDFQIVAFNATGSSPASSPPVTAGIVQQATTRDATTIPFASGSVWNIGIGNAATWMAASDPIIQRLRGLNGAINGANFGQPIYFGGSSDPVVTLNCTGQGPVGNVPFSIDFHVPASAQPAGGTDKHMNFYDSTKQNVAVSLFNCSSTDFGNLRSGSVINSFLGGVLDLTKNGTNATLDPAPADFTGTDNYLAGVITEYDILTAGAINHMVRIAISENASLSPNSTPGSSQNVPWPNFHVDYNAPTEYTGIIPAGSTFGIPASVNLGSLGLSQGGMMLATCLQNYGAVWRDSAGTDEIAFYTTPTLESNATIGQMRADLPKILAVMSMMTNQGQNNVNGNSTYRVALLPPVSGTSPPPQPVTPPPSSGVSPPSQAVAAGYTHPAFFSGFDSPSEVSTVTDGSVTAPWYVSGGGLNFTIANSVLTLNNSISSFNDDVKTVCGGGARLSAPGAIVAGNGFGLAFQYGYFEAKLKFDPSNVTGGGWIAWWSASFESNILNQNALNSAEIDFVESFAGGSVWSNTSCGVINWFGTNSGQFGSYFGCLGAPGLQGPPSSATIASSGIDPADWNIFGCLNTPTYVEMYWNSATRRANGVADTLVQHINTTVPSGGELNNNGQVTTGLYDGVNTGHRHLILGGPNHANGLQADYVAVWQ